MTKDRRKAQQQQFVVHLLESIGGMNFGQISKTRVTQKQVKDTATECH